MSKEMTYASVGVDRDLRAKSKKGLKSLNETYVYSEGEILHLPYGNLKPITFGSSTLYKDLKIEGIGTKVLLAQLADIYDTIGEDGVAMAVNDVIRSGAKPDSIADNIDAEKSDPFLVNEWMKGLIKGAHKTRAPIVDGEIADVAVLIRGIKEGRGFHIVCACDGYVEKDKIIYGSNLTSGDPIISLRSSGVHSNGISLVRAVLFAEWGGFYKDPFKRVDELDTELILEVLKPTEIYTKPVLMVNDKFGSKAAVHVTGDAYLKFDKLLECNPGIGFEFNDLRPQPIFGIIEKAAKKLGKPISNLEMTKTFNLGSGFELIVDRKDKDDVLDFLEKMGVEAWQAGVVNDSGRITVVCNGDKLILK